MKRYLFGILGLFLLSVASAEEPAAIALQRIGEASQSAVRLLGRLIPDLPAGSTTTAAPHTSSPSAGQPAVPHFRISLSM